MRAVRVVKKFVEYLRTDFKEIVLPSSMPDPPGTPPPLKFRELIPLHIQAVVEGTKMYIENVKTTFGSDKLKEKDSTVENGTSEDGTGGPSFREELEGIARSGGDAAKPFFQRLYAVRAQAYRDAIKEFIAGYQEGFKAALEPPKETPVPTPSSSGSHGPRDASAGRNEEEVTEDSKAAAANRPFILCAGHVTVAEHVNRTDEYVVFMKPPLRHWMYFGGDQKSAWEEGKPTKLEDAFSSLRNNESAVLFFGDEPKDVVRVATTPIELTESGATFSVSILGVAQRLKVSSHNVDPHPAEAPANSSPLSITSSPLSIMFVRDQEGELASSMGLVVAEESGHEDSGQSQETPVLAPSSTGSHDTPAGFQDPNQWQETPVPALSTASTLHDDSGQRGDSDQSQETPVPTPDVTFVSHDLAESHEDLEKENPQ